MSRTPCPKLEAFLVGLDERIRMFTMRHIKELPSKKVPSNRKQNVCAVNRVIILFAVFFLLLCGLKVML